MRDALLTLHLPVGTLVSSWLEEGVFESADTDETVCDYDWMHAYLNELSRMKIKPSSSLLLLHYI